MGSPTTARYALLRVKKGFGDKLYLTLGSDAGASSFNPLLVGLGVRFVLVATTGVTDVSAELSRIVDGAATSPRAIEVVPTSEGQWQISGALGGPTLGFPTDPPPNYGTPQCFQLSVTFRKGPSARVYLYHLWVSDGTIGTLVEHTDRAMQAATPVALFVEDEFTDPAEIAFHNIREFVDEDNTAASVYDGPETVLNLYTGEKGYFPAGLPIFSELSSAAGVVQLDNLDAFDGTSIVNEPFTGFEDPAVPAALTFFEACAAGFASQYFSVTGQGVHHHNDHIRVPTFGSLSAAPGQTSNDVEFIATDNSVLTSPNEHRNGIAVFENGYLLDCAVDTISLSALTSTTIVLERVSHVSADLDAVVVAGEAAVWDGVSPLNGSEINFAGGYEKILLNPTNPAALAAGPFWTPLPGPGEILDLTGDGPFEISIRALNTLLVGDIMAVQIIITPSTITTGVVSGSPTLGLEVSNDTICSNVLLFEVTA